MEKWKTRGRRKAGACCWLTVLGSGRLSLWPLFKAGWSSVAEGSCSRSWVLDVTVEVQLGPGQPIAPAALPKSIVRGMLSFLQGGFGDTPVCPCGDHWPGFSCPLGEPRDWFCRFSRRSPNLGGLSHAGKLITSRFIQSEFATGDRLCRRRCSQGNLSRKKQIRQRAEGAWGLVGGCLWPQRIFWRRL